ncbi:MAG: hypothetical protein EPO20_07590 [Betaproteobacteria bacterium]|nr:MAG: hypothetical protein EPO20_07590 [Betaproteobacteria bacterium]
MRLPTIVYMRSARQKKLAAGAGLLIALLIVLVAAAPLEPSLTAAAALAFSVLAFGIALLGVAKARMLEFCPEVLGGDLILPRASAGRLLLPLQFSNAGYADGIIEWLAIRLTVNGDASREVLLSPVGEVDMQRFIQAKRRLTDDNLLEPFTSFPLEGKRALAKFVLFDVAERPRAPSLRLQPGRYGFELFIKANNCRHPQLARAFEHVVEQKHIEDYRDDAAVYLINYQITLASARRALAESEWLPRASMGEASAR